MYLCVFQAIYILPASLILNFFVALRPMIVGHIGINELPREKKPNPAGEPHEFPRFSIKPLFCRVLLFRTEPFGQCLVRSSGSWVSQWFKLHFFPLKS